MTGKLPIVHDTPVPPTTRIRVSGTPHGLGFTWTTPRRLSVPQVFRAAFLAFWLVGWLAGEVLVGGMVLGTLWALLSGRWRAEMLLITAFCVAWLVAWTFGGLRALAEFLNVLRGPRPECIVLAERALFHVPRRTRTIRNVMQLRGWLHAVRAGTRIRRNQVLSLRLDNAGPRPRLVVDHGGRSTEIGEQLEDVEREWLADVIRSWANDSGYR